MGPLTRLSTPAALTAFLASLTNGGPAAADKRDAPAPEKSADFALRDPVGDGDGPGTYTYPTNPVYKPGSFDITEFRVARSGSSVELSVTVNALIEDPWDSRAWGGNGFSLQMVFIHIDTDHKEGSGVIEGLPGTHVRFAAAEAWDRAIILSPQGPTRLHKEVELKCPQWKDRILIPRITRASDRTLVAVLDVSALGEPQPSWGYQVLMQSNEGYADRKELLTRRVNESAGPHRFGGGADGDDDPHVLDILVPPGGDAAKKQHALLARYKAGGGADPSNLALVPMVYPLARAK